MTIIRTAPAPGSATNTVVLSAGLLSIPLSVYTGVESSGIKRREFYRGDINVPVGRATIRRDTGEVIESGDVTRMAEATSGAWVQLDDQEIVEAAGPSGGCEVVTFVPQAHTSRYLTESLYQVRPKNDKHGKTAAAAFALLLAGMRVRKVNALVRVTLRKGPRYALLTTDGDLLMLATADTVREQRELPDVVPDKAEVQMVASLIDTIGIDTPTLTDTVTVAVQEYIDTKAATAGVDGGEQVSPAPHINLAEQLQASIDAVKAEKAPARKPARKRKAAA